MVDVLITKMADAARASACACLRVRRSGGQQGIACRRRRTAACPASIPPFFLCTDNAAMIGAAAHYRLLSDGPSALDFDVEPDLGLAVGE